MKSKNRNILIFIGIGGRALTFCKLKSSTKDIYLFVKTEKEYEEFYLTLKKRRR